MKDKKRWITAERWLSGVLWFIWPRVKTTKCLPETVKADLDLFRSFVDQTLHIPANQLSLSFQVALEIQDLMVEQNRSNFSIHFNTIAKLSGSKQDAYLAVSAFLKMRENEWTLTSEKKEIVAIVSSMKSIVSMESKTLQEDADSQKSAADFTEPLVKKSKNGSIVITLHVGDLKALWNLED
jgi:hypothetical protein